LLLVCYTLGFDNSGKEKVVSLWCHPMRDLNLIYLKDYPDTVLERRRIGLESHTSGFG
jgi:hypothetical protein